MSFMFFALRYLAIMYTTQLIYVSNYDTNRYYMLNGMGAVGLELSKKKVRKNVIANQG